MHRLFERAAYWGVDTDYCDALGTRRAVDPEVLAHLLDAFPAVAARERVLPRSIVLRGRYECVVRLNVPDELPVRWALSSARGSIAVGRGGSPFLTLPADLPSGVYRLEVTVTSPSGALSENTSVVVCPKRAHQGDERAPRRMWALAIQLYGVRSQRNWGHGDFGDLASLLALAADLGAAGIALNPLHALFDDSPQQASPYSPSSRLFLNPLYIDIESVPEFPGVKAVGLEDAIARLRTQTIVDYPGVADAKRHALRLAYDAFCRSASADRKKALDQFRQDRGDTLSRFASFEVLRRRFKCPWWEWPQEWRRPDQDALDRLRVSEEADVGYCEFVQWIAHEQLEQCRLSAVERRLPIGLYLDVAVGVRSDGFDAWSAQGAFLPRMSIGAPPDMLNTKGQNWGLVGFNPIGLQEGQFEPFIRMLQASMRHSGAIRLDHVLGLKRLFVIPEGMRPASGAYIRLPFEALLAVTTLLSVQHTCIVIGEDLGTVPDNFRETLADWGLWSYQLMLFERGSDGTFSAPESYRENALVAFATHDLPTFAGWTDQHDFATREALSIDPGETREERHRTLETLRRTLEQRGMGLNFPSVARYLADTPSRLLVIAMEDVLELTEQVNVPGTIDEHPNWRRRLPISLENFWTHEGLRALATAFERAGRSIKALGTADG